MSNDESRQGARGWLAKDHTYRRRIIDEIQKRADYPIRQRARVTRLMMAGDTATDVFRENLLDELKLNDLKASEDDKRDHLRDIILELSPNRDRRPMKYEHDVLANAISKIIELDPPVQKAFKDDITQQFNTLLEAFEHPPIKRELVKFDDGRDVEFSQMPFRNGGARGKYWLDFTGVAEGTNPKTSRLRVHREAYPANETLNILEDFGSKDDVPERPYLMRTSQGARINTDIAAIDAFDKLLSDHPSTLGRFKWIGKLLCISHFWIIPAYEALDDLDPELIDRAAASLRADPRAQSNEIGELFKSASMFARRSFPHRDATCDHAQRSDHVLTVLGNGETILIADFQAHSRQSAKGERATRYVLLNLSASEDKLGRIMMKLNDIEAYRIAALRDYQFTFPVTNVIDGCNAHIAIAENEAAQTPNKRLARNHRRERMGKLLREIAGLSARITAANHFIEGGLVGLADRGAEMRELMHNRLTDLNEREVLGFQSLEGYVRKVDNAIASMQRSKSRYVRARNRIDEILNLAKAELDQVTARQNVLIGGTVVALTVVITFIEVASWFEESPIYLAAIELRDTFISLLLHPLSLAVLLVLASLLSARWIFIRVGRLLSNFFAKRRRGTRTGSIKGRK